MGPDKGQKKGIGDLGKHEGKPGPAQKMKPKGNPL
jgi:hypothetical protein